MKTFGTTLDGSFAPLRLCVSFILFFAATAAAESPLAVPVDRGPFRGKLTSVDARWKLGFTVDDGKPRTLSADDLVSWGHPAELRKGPIVVLADGGRLAAAVTGADKTRLAVTSPRLGTLHLPLDSLAGIVFRARPVRRTSMPCWTASPAIEAAPIGCSWTTATRSPD